MRVSYNKLWKLLIDKGIKKPELCKMAGISQATACKMQKGHASAEVLRKICATLDCQIDDILEITSDE